MARRSPWAITKRRRTRFCTSLTLLYRRRLRKQRRQSERTFGASLLRLRKQRRLKRSDFAPISSKEIARIERNEVGKPHAKTLEPSRLGSVSGRKRSKLVDGWRLQRAWSGYGTIQAKCLEQSSLFTDWSRGSGDVEASRYTRSGRIATIVILVLAASVGHVVFTGRAAADEPADAPLPEISPRNWPRSCARPWAGTMTRARSGSSSPTPGT